MKKETLIVMVKLVVDTSYRDTAETALELRDKLKLKMIDSERVNLLEAKLIGCMAADSPDDDQGVALVN